MTASVTTVARPTYYRFAYSPTTGDVTLSHNQEAHPARLPLHSDMVKERVEDDLIIGYAYRIVGGWRITDADHAPIGDPHIIESVVKEINGEIPKTASSLRRGEWRTFHYGR